MFLDNEARCSRRERITARAENRRSCRFRDCREFCGHDRSIESDRNETGNRIRHLRRPGAAAAKLSRHRRAGHRENAEHVCFSIGNSDRNGMAQ